MTVYRDEGFIDLQRKILDDIVSINSFLTVAVFAGLSVSFTDQSALGLQPECLPVSGLPREVIILELLSFGCFVCSSYIAKAGNLYIGIFHGSYRKRRASFLSLSVLISTVGVGLLTASVAFLAETKVGKLSCGTDSALTALAPLCVLVVIGVFTYLSTMSWAIFFRIH